MARPKKEINWDKVDKALMAGANGVQVSAMLGIHFNTLSKKCEEAHKCGFSEYMETKREKGNNLLHSKQFELAIDGDKAMLIWLGKQRLNQSDKKEVHQTVKQEERTLSEVQEELKRLEALKQSENEQFDDD